MQRETALRAEEKRIEGRLENAKHLFLVSCVLTSHGKTIPCQLINYHHKGACLEIPSEWQGTIERTDFQIDIYWGKKRIWEDIDFRVAWKSTSPTYTVGIEFLNPIGSWLTRPERFKSHPQFRPTVSASDPLNLNRTILFQVLNISESGLLLSTSLTNKHLITGMPLINSRIHFPGEDSLPLKLAIKNTRRSDQDGFFDLGVTIDEKSHAFRQAAKRYVTSLANTSDNENRIESISRKGMLSKTIKSSLSFRTVTDRATYDQVLKLRFLGYEAHGKVKDGSTWKDQGEGLENEGVIVGAFLGSELVASMEMRFGNSRLPFRITSLFERSALPQIDFNRLCEVNKLVIHPQAQGSDILIGMIQICHSMLVTNGGLDVVITATDQLVPIYRRIGFEKLGHSVPHPVVENTYLHLMLMKSDAYLRAKKIHIFYWAMVMRQTQDQMAELGVSDRVNLTPWQRLKVISFGLIHRLQRKYRARKWERQHRAVTLKTSVGLTQPSAEAVEKA